MLKKIIFSGIIFLFFSNFVYSSKSYKFLIPFYTYENFEIEKESEIVNKSLLPTIEMYLKHPDWYIDIELPGYMLEILKEKYPEILNKINILIERGQLNISSFHYSKKFYLCFPLFDMEKSEKINREILEKCKIPDSEVISSEEEFGEGLILFMKKYGYKIAVVSEEFLNSFQKEKEIFPYYEKDGIYILVKKEINYNNGEIQVIWLKGDEDENYIKELEKQGFKTINISNYVKKLKELNIKVKKIENILDFIKNPQKMQTEKISLSYKIRQELLGCEVLISNAKILNIDTEEEEKKLKEAWKYHFLLKRDETKKIVDEIFVNLKKKLKYEGFAIDTRKNNIVKTIGKITFGPISSLFPKVKCPYPVKIELKEKNVHYHFETYNFIKNRYDIKIEFINKNSYPVKAKIFFKRKTDEIIYSPSLLEEKIVKYPLKNFPFEYIYLPLSNGLIGLSKNIFLIKHNSFNHIAPKIGKNSKYIVFEFNNILPGKNQYQFTLAYADEEISLNLANNINTFPILTK